MWKLVSSSCAARGSAPRQRHAQLLEGARRSAGGCGRGSIAGAERRVRGARMCVFAGTSGYGREGVTFSKVMGETWMPLSEAPSSLAISVPMMDCAPQQRQYRMVAARAGVCARALGARLVVAGGLRRGVGGLGVRLDFDAGLGHERRHVDGGGERGGAGEVGVPRGARQPVHGRLERRQRVHAAHVRLVVRREDERAREALGRRPEGGAGRRRRVLRERERELHDAVVEVVLNSRVG